MQQPKYRQIFAGHTEGTAMAERAHIVWVTGKSNLESRGLWLDAASWSLDRLARAISEYEMLQPIALAEGPILIGPNGGMYANMRWSMVLKLGEHIAKLERALLLTPEAASGEKIIPKKGAPSAADEFLNMA